MSLSDEILIAVALVLSEEGKIIKKQRKRKRLWMKEWHKKRSRFTHQNLLGELSVSDPSDLKIFLRMDSTVYENLLELVTPLIKKHDTNMREAIPVDQRLSITLRYLATGNTFADPKFTSAVSAPSIGNIVIETCSAIVTVLKDYIKVPETQEEWKLVAEGFQKKWNFPQCLGAVDGKHVAIKKPNNSGSFYFNYKKFFSVVLMAVVDSNYEFLMVDVGVNGRISDGGVFRHTPFGDAFYKNRLELPQPNYLPDSEKELPFVFVGDDAFQLTEHFLKPFPHTGLSREQRIFNYRLSRARRVVENAFGILAARFGVFQRPINLDPEKVQTIVLACCYLHNFLRRHHSEQYISSSYLDREDVQTGTMDIGSWRQGFELESLQNTTSRNSTNDAKNIREEFCNYFNNEGQVPWQNNIL